MAELGTRTSPVFVIGHPRSGTTLLRLILNEHSRLVVPPEAHLVSYLRRAERNHGALSDPGNRRRMAERLVDRQRMRDWGFDRDVMLERVLAAPPTPGGIMGALMALWTEQTGKPRWGEKTPGTYRFLPDVTAWFPDCQVVHILRDGRDVAVSCLTPPFSDRYDKGNVYEVAVRWRDAVRRGWRAAERLGPERYRELRYEDLTADPEAEVRRLCAFLGEAFEPTMLEYHRRARAAVVQGEGTYHQRIEGEVDRQRVERWRQDAEPSFVAAFEGVAGKELTRLGYTLSGYDAGAAQRMRILYEKYRPRRLVKNYRPKKSPPTPS